MGTVGAAMKNLFLFSIFCLAFFQPVFGIFLGPVAVGAVLGALAVGKGFILGSLLSRRRTRTQSYRSKRSYSYNPYSHYKQQPAYYSHYTKPNAHYYSSNSYTYRGKRFALDAVEIERFTREIADKIMTDEWYLEMVEKDQDDCTKRLICEVSYKRASGRTLNSVEEGVMEIFGKGLTVGTSKTTAIFDFAAQAGKYWKAGGVGCDFYRRCDTPIDDILTMIETELDDFEKLEQSMVGSKESAEAEMINEKEEVQTMLQSLDPDFILE